MGETNASARPRNRFAKAHNQLAHVLLNLLIVFVLLNGALAMFPGLRASAAVDSPIRFFGLDRITLAYPGWTAADVERLHEESRVVFGYEPVLQFRIKPIVGTYVNVGPQGLRSNKHPAVWPPTAEAFNVFVFGGSTTFGWLLPDRETIPSFLQDRIDRAECARPVRVYNFAHPSYVSTQEALLFQQLVLAGTGPDAAIFFDGFNEFFFRGELSYTNALTRLVDGTDLTTRFGLLTRLPLYQMLRRVNARFYQDPGLEPAEERKLFDRVIALYERSRALARMVASAHRIHLLFGWQPIASYEYDLSHHFLYRDNPPVGDTDRPFPDIARGYALMNTRRSALEADGDFLWLADMQQGVRENLYVDRMHYNSVASSRIAERLFVRLQSQGMLPCSGGDAGNASVEDSHAHRQ
jgi:hypothetical protein